MLRGAGQWCGYWVQDWVTGRCQWSDLRGSVWSCSGPNQAGLVWLGRSGLGLGSV